jgi:hypothetical protein
VVFIPIPEMNIESAVLSCSDCKAVFISEIFMDSNLRLARLAVEKIKAYKKAALIPKGRLRFLQFDFTDAVSRAAKKGQPIV